MSLLPALASAAAANDPVRLKQRIRLGLIGLVAHSNEILAPLRQLPDVELVAISETDAKVRTGFAQFPSAKRYDNHQAMLDQEKFDVVAVCNQNGDRARAVLDVLARKIHVIAEKPLAIELADFDKVRAAVAKSGVQLGMLLPMRFDAQFLAMRQVVASGQIGEVALMTAQKSYIGPGRDKWFTERASYGGTFPWIGPHMVDLMLWTSGRNITEVFAHQAHLGYPEMGDMENVTTAQFRLDNGGSATLNMDYLRPRTADTSSDDRLRLAGTKGVVEYQQSTGVTLMVDGAKPQRLTQLPERQSVFIDFLQGIYGNRPTTLTLPEIYRVNNIVLQARKSAETGRVLRLQSKPA